MRIEIMIDKEQKISQSTLDALESELYRNLRPLYPKTAIRIRKGSANGIELTGLKLDEDKQRVMEIMPRSASFSAWLAFCSTRKIVIPCSRSCSMVSKIC